MRIDTGSGMVYVQRDHTARNDELGPEVRITEEQKAATRKTVCSWAARKNLTAADAALVMQALGVYPTTDDEDYLTGPPESVYCGPGAQMS